MVTQNQLPFDTQMKTALFSVSYTSEDLTTESSGFVTVHLVLYLETCEF